MDPSPQQAIKNPAAASLQSRSTDWGRVSGKINGIGAPQASSNPGKMESQRFYSSDREDWSELSDSDCPTRLGFSSDSIQLITS